MKANQVLRLYRNGIRDFRGENLRGQSFKGQDISGSDFSEADIRGAHFEEAKLRGVIFKKAKAGLEILSMSALLIASFLLSALSGFCSALSGYLLSLMFATYSLESTVASRVVLLILIGFFLFTILQGIETGLGFLGVASVFAIAGTFALAVTGAFNVAPTVAGVIAGTLVGTFAGAVAVAIAGTLAGTFAGVVAVAIAGTLAGTFAGVVAGAVAQTVAGAGVIAGVIAVIVIITSAYIAWRALAGDDKYALVRKITIAIVAIGGTNFRGADLTDANFTEANLKSTDFRNAKLTRTCFNKTKKLHRVRPGLTYLQQAELIKVLTRGQGKDKNFDRQDLRGVNFQGAYLVDASFIGADLSEANLQNADLSRAKLKQTQVDGTDFTGATLTGAFIEDWGITRDTKFDGVRCEYVYMRLPTIENPDPWRKPDSREEVFADGEFGDFIKPIVDTLDLYHNQGVDPRAIAISFKQLAENHPEAELRIVGMEVKDEDKFLLRAKTAPMADKSELSAEYFSIYNNLKALAQQEVKALLAEKDSRISSLEIMVNTTLQSPKFFAQTYNNQGDTMPKGSKRESNFNFQNPQFAGGLVNAEIVNAHQIGGNITNYTSEQKQNLAQAAAEIQQLIYQLSQANETTNEAITEALHQEIKCNPTLKARLQAAFKAGGLEALKAIFNHPLFSIPAETIKGWLEAE
ncbi:pentapeptide repeat-containing protein [Brasilonema sp. CT11]|nr:pentapeptide repeat-containing protein [Brasilonema sp. CT11]